MRIVPEQIARFVPGRPFMVLGTDGMGRSDTREALRRHFEIDLPHLVTTVLYELAKVGAVSRATVDEAIAHYGVDPEAFSPLHA
jgi:pyruvate dehydrogenase E1 component